MEINVNRLQHWTKTTPNQKKRECWCVCVYIAYYLLCDESSFGWIIPVFICQALLICLNSSLKFALKKKKKTHTHVPTHCVPKKKEISERKNRLKRRSGRFSD